MPNTNVVTIDLDQFKLHIGLKERIELTLHFNSPSRRFYVSLIALLVNEMKRSGKISSTSLEGHYSLLALLNETVGESAGSSEKGNLLPRIYRKWQQALPNLEEAPLFKIVGKKKEYGEGVSKAYPLTETEKDSWASLFEYRGSEENVRLKFAIDKIGVRLDDVAILYDGALDGDAWGKFVSDLKDKKGVAPEMQIRQVREEPTPSVPPQKKWKTVRPSRRRWIVLLVGIALVLGAATWAIREISFGPVPITTTPSQGTALPLPENPSIAVLPFVNMSDDPKQDFLVDGIAENIITALSKIPRLLVISRQSTFFYRSNPVKASQVGADLGVRYVLEGSVQRTADRIRISAQLLDTSIGNHLWAGRYDRDVKDLFDLQDEITIRILTAIRVKLAEGESVSGIGKYFKGKHGFDCYLTLMEANGIRLHFNIGAANRARQMIEETMRMCPENPMVHTALAWVYHSDYMLRNTKSPEETIEKGIELAQKALELDNSISGAHVVLCYLYQDKGQYDEAIAEGERAVALNPNGAMELNSYANSLRAAGRPEEAIPFYQRAIRLSPIGAAGLYRDFGTALWRTGRFEQAVSVYRRAIQITPDDILAHMGLTATYMLMGREKEARTEAAEVLKLNPEFSVDNLVNSAPSASKAQLDTFAEALRKAGLK